MEKHNITGVILAGGTSRRMGFNKELIEINGERLVYRQIDILSSIFNEVIVVSNHSKFYKDKDILIIEDILESKGPLTGLHTALLNSKNEYIYLIACDMPNIDISYINNQIKSLHKPMKVYEEDGYYEPFHGFYSKTLIKPLENFLSTQSKFQDFINNQEKDIIHDIESYESELFFNLNTPIDIYHLEHKNDAYKSFKIHKKTQKGLVSKTDYVVDEYPIILYVNEVKYATLLITPKNIEELIIGYLRSEKIIDNYKDITSIEIDKDDNKADITVNKELDFSTLGKDKILVSGCGVGTKFHEDLDNVLLDSISSEFQISSTDIHNASTNLNNQSGLFKLTGGVHSCLYVYDDKEVYFEDIGRHNAVDKVVGFITKHNIITTNSFIFSSGRISSDMLLKCAISGIPIVISRSAPTSLAVTLADKYGITLLGFARGEKLNIYTHKKRIQI